MIMVCMVMRTADGTSREGNPRERDAELHIQTSKDKLKCKHRRRSRRFILPIRRARLSALPTASPSAIPRESTLRLIDLVKKAEYAVVGHTEARVEVAHHVRHQRRAPIFDMLHVVPYVTVRRWM